MDVIKHTIEEQKHQLRLLWKNKRALAFQTLNLALIAASALMIWKALMVYTESESPVVVVLSGSMRPMFDKGDILFLHNTNYTPVRVGEIVVFKVTGREIPIVHRVSQVHEDETGMVQMLTKGDNNTVNDRGLYARGQQWLLRDHIVGRAKLMIPYVGYFTILLNENPYFKYLLVGGMGFFVFTNKE